MCVLIIPFVKQEKETRGSDYQRRTPIRIRDLQEFTTNFFRDSIQCDAEQSDFFHCITVFALQVESVSLVVQPKVGKVIKIDFFLTPLASIQE